MKVVSKFPLRLLAQLEAFKYCSRLQQTSYKVEPNVEIPRWTDSGFFAAERCARHTSSQAGINGSHVIIWTPANEPGYVGYVAKPGIIAVHTVVPCQREQMHLRAFHGSAGLKPQRCLGRQSLRLRRRSSRHEKWLKQMQNLHSANGARKV